MAQEGPSAPLFCNSRGGRTAGEGEVVRVAVDGGQGRVAFHPLPAHHSGRCGLTAVRFSAGLNSALIAPQVAGSTATDSARMPKL